MTVKYRCPICEGEINISGNTARCGAGHCFDRAREGYYNLLISQGKGVHGDNPDMVLARRAFLTTGAYQPLRTLLSELCEKYTPHCGNLLDVGCGEGYYTAGIAERLKDAGRDAAVFGFDISKDAVRQAAKLRSGASLSVASAYKMPYFDEQFDTVINVFSPIAREETLRVLKPHGHFIMAFPGEEHLLGLKEKIYDTPYKNKPEDSELAGFTLKETQRLRYELWLDTPEKIRNLFMMTPYAYRTGAEGRERVLSLTSLKTDIEFLIYVYEKTE